MKNLSFYNQTYGEGNFAVHKWLKERNGGGYPYVQAQFTTMLVNDELIINYETDEMYPTFNLVDGNLIMTYDETKPLNIYINDEGYLIERSFDGMPERNLGKVTGPKGDTGDAFTYSDFTPEELEGLKGPKGDPGDKGAAFTYSDFTPEELEGLKGPKGDTGDAFTYSDFTPEELEGLKGPKGDDGLTVSATIDGVVYTQENGTITLPVKPVDITYEDGTTLVGKMVIKEDA